MDSKGSGPQLGSLERKERRRDEIFESQAEVRRHVLGEPPTRTTPWALAT